MCDEPISGAADDEPFRLWLDQEEKRRSCICAMCAREDAVIDAFQLPEYDTWTDGIPDCGCYDQEEPGMVDRHGNHINDFRPLDIPNDFEHEE